MIEYQILLQSPHQHTVVVKQSFEDEGKAPVLLQMPAWLPGSYTLRDFSKNIVSIKAYPSHAPTRHLNLDKQDSHTYQLEAFQGQVTIEYEVYCWDRSVRGSHFDLTHGFFNFSSLCLYSPSHKSLPVQVQLVQPSQTYENKAWVVATTLPIIDVDEHGFGSYKAPNYESLIDHPVEMGEMDLCEFKSNGVVHDIAVTGRHQGDLQRLTTDVNKICDYHNQLFGETPFDKYLFLLTVMENGYGGLEHKDSTALMCDTKCLPIKDLTEDKDYRQLLGLFSHEYFHAWHVKRIKPLEFYNLDLTKPHYTKQLWAFEGITSYYDDIALVRSGCITQEAYLELLAQTISRVYQGSGRHKQTVKESSFDAWTKFYHPNENSPNSLVSYYTKGSLCAMVFDLFIRHQTDYQKSLDDVMRLLWQNYGSKDLGVPDGNIEQLLIEVAGDKIKPLIDLALHSTEDLPLEDMLASIGVELSWHYPKESQSISDKPPVSLGCRIHQQKITHVLDNGSAQKAGLCAGDVLVALNDCQVTTTNLATRLSRMQPGQMVKAHVFREERLLSFEIELQACEKHDAKLTLMDDADATIIKARNQWLS